MKRIEYKCKCGAEAIFEDPDDTYMLPEPTEPGERIPLDPDRYVIKRWADQWVRHHSNCNVRHPEDSLVASMSTREGRAVIVTAVRQAKLNGEI